jgi:hypothetical protein
MFIVMGMLIGSLIQRSIIPLIYFVCLFGYIICRMEASILRENVVLYTI